MAADDNKHAILKETAARIRQLMPAGAWHEVRIERAIFGLHFSGVKLSNGYGGLCYTWRFRIPSRLFSAGMIPDSVRLRGMSVGTALENMYDGTILQRTLGIAVLNALSNTIWSEDMPQDYLMERDVGSIDCIDFTPNEYVVVVGALPYVKTLKDANIPFCVLELDPSMLQEEYLPFYIPGDKAPEIVPTADTLISTGATLIGDTLEDLLSLVKPSARVVMFGPTCSMLPDAFFRRGVSKIIGTIVRRPDEFLDIIGEAGSGGQFPESVGKIVITRNTVKAEKNTQIGMK